MSQKIKIIVAVFLLLVSNLLFAQFKSIKGIVIANGDVEGIHILNQSSVKYDVTNTNGNFEIFAKLNDTLIISALKYKTKTVILNVDKFNKIILHIKLEEKIDELEEVFVGKQLTGSLNSDVGNIETKEEINFYNMGIPGYTGKPKTFSERLLLEATNTTGGNNLGALINSITGKTKMLEERIERDKDIFCVNQLKSKNSALIFQDKDFSELQKTKFFIFLRDSEDLRSVCRNDNKLLLIEFMQKELKLFIKRQKEDVSKD